MTAIPSEYRVLIPHPDLADRILVTWRPKTPDTGWFHVAIADDIHQACEEIVRHKNRNDQ